MANLKKMTDECYQTSKESGWWVEYDIITINLKTAKNYGLDELVDFWEIMQLNWLAAQLALIHSEVSEMEEAETDDKFAEELADICIRVFSLIGGLKVKLNSVIFFGISLIRHDRDINWYISKALRHLRDGQCHNFHQALADIYTRCLVKAEYYGVNLEEAIKKKMEYNKTRPYKHGGKKL